MPAKRRSGSNRRGTKKKASGGIPAWFWLLGGILIGLGVAAFLMIKGYLPEIKQHLPSVDSSASGKTESALVEDEIAEPKKPRYDFFTVLPEMEVVVPEQELSRNRRSKRSNTMTRSILQPKRNQNAAYCVNIY